MYVCDSIILMNQGEILSTGSPEEISKDPLQRSFILVNNNFLNNQ